MVNIKKHGITIEESPKCVGPVSWRVVTRSCNSGRVLKIWFDKVTLYEAELLAKGIRESNTG